MSSGECGLKKNFNVRSCYLGQIAAARRRTNAHNSREFHLFATPNYDVKIATAMFIAQPVEQVIEGRADKNGRENLFGVVHSVDVCPKPEVVVIQELEQQFIEPVIPEDIRNRSIWSALWRILHRVFRGVRPVCGRCVAVCGPVCVALCGNERLGDSAGSTLIPGFLQAEERRSASLL